jgi:hypothetical protein
MLIQTLDDIENWRAERAGDSKDAAVARVRQRAD